MYILQETANAVRSPGKAEDPPLPVTQFGWFLTIVQCLVSPIRAQHLERTQHQHPLGVINPTAAVLQVTRCVSQLDVISSRIFRRVCKIAKSDYQLRHVCLSVRPHRTTRLPLDGLSLNFIFEYFWKIFPENSGFMNT